MKFLVVLCALVALSVGQQCVEQCNAQAGNCVQNCHNTYEQYCYMGMKSGAILDGAITASSYWDNSPQFKPANGRLDSTAYWHIGSGDTVAPWFQVDLLIAKTVVGVITQGRTSGAEQWITSFSVKYGDSVAALDFVKDGNNNAIVFAGNVDISTHLKTMFPSPVMARFVRFYPRTWHGLWCSGRFEILSC